MLHSLNRLSYKRAMLAVIYSTILSNLVFAGVAILGALVFGELITETDTLVKALYLYTNSFTTLLTQMVYALIGIYHAPIYLFNVRESVLFFFNSSFKCARRPHHAGPPFPNMYERVPRFLFYLIAFGVYALQIVIALYI